MFFHSLSKTHFLLLPSSPLPSTLCLSMHVLCESLIFMHEFIPLNRRNTNHHTCIGVCEHKFVCKEPVTIVSNQSVIFAVKSQIKITLRPRLDTTRRLIYSNRTRTYPNNKVRHLLVQLVLTMYINSIGLQPLCAFNLCKKILRCAVYLPDP